ncbi:MAG: AAA family ATPase [Dehalococcoidia bacterium]|jgi:Cdc6-like AAA superfamily ATPase
MMTSEQLKKFEKLNRAFTPNQPIYLPDFLAGRLDLLFKVQDRVKTPGLHIILYGERGTGKTSIARVLAHLLQEPKKQDGYRSIFVGCVSSDGYASIWNKISREILTAQRQLGFTQQGLATITGRLDITNTINEPNDARLFVEALPNPSIIIIDEFDRVPTHTNTRRLMADTIKLFSDTNTKSTLIIVGVAESISELFSEHQSITRNIDEIHVEPMNITELSEIIQKGYKLAELKYQKNIDVLIAGLSQGYPHYTHLLGLWAGRHAVEEDRTEVTTADLDRAINDALQNVTGSVKQEYEKAIDSAYPNALFKDVLLACALAPKDSVGKFSLADVKEPLSRITGHDYQTSAYQAHLAKFCEPKRGPVLKRTGERRNYRWKFINPHLIAYVQLAGIEDGSIAKTY